MARVYWATIFNFVFVQFFFGQYNLYDKSIILDSAELKHCLKVLRKKKGDLIKVTDGTGKYYVTEIIDDNWNSPQFRCIEVKEAGINNCKLSIAIALTKNLQRIEWFLEKSTEIGLDEIYFIQTKRSEKASVKKLRFINILKSAAKQSGNLKIPKLHDPISLSELFTKVKTINAQKFIAYCEEKQNDHLFHLVEKDIPVIVLIGPEGDFTKDEVEQAIENDFKTISLGNSRLRTETAGIVACEIVNLKNL